MENNKETTLFSWLDGLAFNRFHAVMLLVTGLILAAAGMNLQILSYAMPLMVKEWALSPVKASAMISSGFLGLMTGAVTFGAIADRTGRRKGLMAAIAAFSLAGGAASFAPDYGGFCALRFLAGVGIGGAFPLAVALLAEFSPSKTRARLITVAVSGFTLGWVLAASASMLLIPLFGWRITLRFGILSLLLLPVIGACVPESVRFLMEKGRDHEAVDEVSRIEKMARLTPVSRSAAELAPILPVARGSLAELFRGRLALMTLLVWSTYLLNAMALYGLAAWLPSLLVKEGYSLVKSYSFAMVQAGGAVAGGLLLGCLMDRSGRKGGLILTYLLGGVSVILFGLARTEGHLFWSAAATGVFVVGTPTALNVVCSEIYPTGVRSMGVASTQAAGRIGSILGPMVGGVLQTFGFSFHQFFFLFAMPCFVCMFLVAWYPVNVRGEALETVSSRLGYCIR